MKQEWQFIKAGFYRHPCGAQIMRTSSWWTLQYGLTIRRYSTLREAKEAPL